MSQRTERIDQLLREEISRLLAEEVSDPRIGFATITDVETAPDLRHAKVWVSVIGQPGERSETIAALRRAMPFVRHALGRSLRLKRIPDLHVELDDTAERATRVERLLAEVSAGAAPTADLPLGETLPTPIARVRHDGDADHEPPSAVVPPIPRSRAGRRPDGQRTGPRPKSPNAPKSPKSPKSPRTP
jgi:ribosome-binding factor A